MGQCKERREPDEVGFGHLGRRPETTNHLSSLVFPFYRLFILSTSVYGVLGMENHVRTSYQLVQFIGAKTLCGLARGSPVADQTTMVPAFASCCNRRCCLKLDRSHSWIYSPALLGARSRFRVKAHLINVANTVSRLPSYHE